MLSHLVSVAAVVAVAVAVAAAAEDEKIRGWTGMGNVQPYSYPKSLR